MAWMCLKCYFTVGSIFGFVFAVAQNLNLPIDFPVSLAGNYAELRRNHFHMGLDFRTDNKEDIRILAVEDGYVARMAIQPSGYGKVLYIHHPKLGITSVYAHLNAFRPDLEWWINQIQYAKHLNSIDTTFLQPKFFVKKGEHIAFSGNTGSSEGPHLHFEIRNMSTEKTINPIYYYPQIKDTILPIFKKIVFYHGDEESIFIDKFSVQEINNQTLLLNSNRVGIGIVALDKMNNSPNVLGIYAFRVYADGELKYQFKLDSMSFDWQSHIKAASDFEVEDNDLYKGFYEHCSFNLTDSGGSNGFIELNAQEKKHILLEVYDFHGNMSSVQFYLTTSADYEMDKTYSMDCKQEQVLTDHTNFQLVIPPYGLPENFRVNYTIQKCSGQEVFKINLLNPSIAALRPFQLTYFIPPTISMRDKLYLESIADKKTKTYLGVLRENRLFFPKLKNYGTLTVRYDTNPPEIMSEIQRKAQELILTAIDKESGILDYQLYINGMWRKLYYDEKNNQFIYKIILEDKGKKVKALFEVSDRVGNKKSKIMEILF